MTSIEVETASGPLHVYGVAWRPGRNPESVWDGFKRTEAGGFHVGLVHANWAGEGEQTSPGWTVQEKDLKHCDLDLVLMGGSHTCRQSRIGSCVVISPGTPVNLGYGEWGERYSVIAELSEQGARIERVERKVEQAIDTEIMVKPGQSYEDISRLVTKRIPAGFLGRVRLTGMLKAPLEVDSVQHLLPGDRMIELIDATEIEFPQWGENARVTVERLFSQAMEEKWKSADRKDQTGIMRAYKRGLLTLARKGDSHAY